MAFVAQKADGGGKTKKTQKTNINDAETRDEYAQAMLANADDRGSTSKPPTTQTTPSNYRKPKDKEPSAAETMKFTNMVEQRRNVQQLIQEAEKFRGSVLKSGNNFNEGYGGNAALMVQGYYNNELKLIDEYLENLKAMDAKLAEEQSRITGENTFTVTDTRKTTERVETNYRDTMYCNTEILRENVLPQYKNQDGELKQMFGALCEIDGLDEYDGLKELRLKALDQIVAMQESNGDVEERVENIVKSAERAERENQRQINKTNQLLGIESRPELKTTTLTEEPNESGIGMQLKTEPLTERQKEAYRKKLDELLDIESRPEEELEEEKRGLTRQQTTGALNKQNQLLGIDQALTYAEITNLTDSLLGAYLERGDTYDKYAKELDKIYLAYAVDHDATELENRINNILDKINDEIENKNNDYKSKTAKTKEKQKPKIRPLNPIYKDIIESNNVELMQAFIDTHQGTREAFIVALKLIHDHQKDYHYAVTHLRRTFKPWI